jgi:hypothetical protein
MGEVEIVRVHDSVVDPIANKDRITTLADHSPSLTNVHTDTTKIIELEAI